MDELTTGVEALDELLEGVRVGDNLVMQAPTEVPLNRFSSVFVRSASTAGCPVVMCVTDDDWGPQDPIPGARRLSWAAGQPGSPATVEDARQQLAELDEQVGPGAAFVFASLTGIMHRWGEDAALELFLFACPRLYRQQSLALWLVDPTRHPPRFLARLREITQVVVDLAEDEDGHLCAEVVVAQGRSPNVVGRRVLLDLTGSAIVAASLMTSGRERLGEVIRSHRASRGLAQAELARRIGITPSALSQVERGVRGLSGESLMRLWEALGVPFGPQDTQHDGYRVVRRSSPATVLELPGLHARQVVADAAFGQVWLVDVEPGASGRTAIFDVKAPESVVILSGVLDLDIAGRVETLQEGDAMVATRAAPTAWGNPSSETTQAVWTIHS